MTTICCVCKKTKKKDHWQLEAIENPNTVSHGYCPNCYRNTFLKMLRTYMQGH